MGRQLERTGRSAGDPSLDFLRMLEPGGGIFRRRSFLKFIARVKAEYPEASSTY